MNYQANAATYQPAYAQTVSFINKVYGLMSTALLLTALAAWFTSASVSPGAVYSLRIPALIFEVILVLALSFAATKMPPAAALLCFYLYAAVNGFTLSILFYVFSASSIASTFLVTGASFGAMTVYGTITKRDLTSIGNLLFMALIGIIIASVVNIFLRSNGLDMAISIIGVIVFAGLTTYDTQKIKTIAQHGINDTGIAILGALTLYLDFINLFLYLLRLFGKKR